MPIESSRPLPGGTLEYRVSHRGFVDVTDSGLVRHPARLNHPLLGIARTTYNHLSYEDKIKCQKEIETTVLVYTVRDPDDQTQIIETGSVLDDLWAAYPEVDWVVVHAGRVYTLDNAHNFKGDDPFEYFVRHTRKYKPQPFLILRP